MILRHWFQDDRIGNYWDSKHSLITINGLTTPNVLMQTKIRQTNCVRHQIFWTQLRLLGLLLHESDASLEQAWQTSSSSWKHTTDVDMGNSSPGRGYTIKHKRHWWTRKTHGMSEVEKMHNENTIFIWLLRLAFVLIWWEALARKGEGIRPFTFGWLNL